MGFRWMPEAASSEMIWRILLETLSDWMENLSLEPVTQDSQETR